MLVRPAARGSGPARRVTQFAAVLLHRHERDCDRRLREIVLNESQWRLLARLSPFDRAHALAVRDRLIADGYCDPDLLLAAALHDIGKADERGRVGLEHRIIKVLLEHWYPSSLERFNRPGGSALRHGVYLALHHARLGAELAEATGASPRCCELIRRHHERDEGLTDPELRALNQADEEVGA